MTWHEALYSIAHEPMEPPRSVLRIETADRDEVAAWLRDVAERLAPTPAGPRADVNALRKRLDTAQAAYLQVQGELTATRAAVGAADAEVKRLKAQLDDERERLAADFLKSINILTMQLHDARRERDELRTAAGAGGQDTPARPLSVSVSQDQASERGTDAIEPQNGAEAVACVIKAARAWRTGALILSNEKARALAEAVDALNNGYGGASSLDSLFEVVRAEGERRAEHALRDELGAALRRADHAWRRLIAIGRFLNDDADVFVADPSDPIGGVRELARRMATAEALRRADMQTLGRWAPVIDAAHAWTAEMRRLGGGGPILGTFGQSLAEAVDALDRSEDTERD